MKMPRRKSLRQLFMETIMFVSVFALMGHLSVNFWERYVIQNELSKMKTSLHSLKDTINNIGAAYDHLHKELKDLAEIAENQSPILSPDKPERKSQYTIAQQFLKSMYTQPTKNTNDIDVDVKPTTDEKHTQKQSKGCKKHKNIKTHTTNKPSKGDIKIGPDHYGNKDKTTQHIQDVLEISKLQQSRNASTITRYPLKSTGAGQGMSFYNETYRKHRNRNHRYIRSNIHKCPNEDSDSESEFWKF